MSKTRALLLVALATAVLASPAVAHSHKIKALEIVHPSTAATSAKEVPIYMTIKNGGKVPERLVGASSPIATKIELLPGSDPSKYAIPAGKSLALTSEGPHLMLYGVKKRLDANTMFKMTLQFEKTGRVLVDVMVEEPKAPHKH
jgi:copper(I)-binding protein